MTSEEVMTSVDDLSDDILSKCLGLVGSRSSLASASSVCKRWLQLSSSSSSSTTTSSSSSSFSLWASVLSSEPGWQDLQFSELCLARGPLQLRTHPGDSFDSPRVSNEASRMKTLGYGTLGCTRASQKGASLSASWQMEMDWPRAMRLRHQMPPAIIIDAGSGYCKYGWSTENKPRGRIATFLEFGSMESPVLPRINALLKSIFCELNADPSCHPVVITEPLPNLEGSQSAGAAREQMMDATHSALFGRFRVPRVCILNQASLALFQAKRVSGIVVNIGFKTTTVVPILRGKPIPGGYGVETLSLAAMSVTKCLHHLMEVFGVECNNMLTIRSLKETLCSVAPTSAATDLNTTSLGSASYTLRPEEGGATYTLGAERFLAPEVLFNPMLFGLPSRSVTVGVKESILSCQNLLRSFQDQNQKNRKDQRAQKDKKDQKPKDQDQPQTKKKGLANDSSMLKAEAGVEGEAEGERKVDRGEAAGAGADRGEATEAGGGRKETRADVSLLNDNEDAAELEEAMCHVVLCGGTSAIPGLAERLETELKACLPKELGAKLRVHSNKYGYDAPWMGGKIISQTSTFPTAWCLSREQYQGEIRGNENSLAMDVKLRLRR